MTVSSSTRSLPGRLLVSACFAQLLTYTLPVSAEIRFDVRTLISDDGSSGIADGNLVNGWGVSYGPTGPFWVSANGTGTSTVYTVNPITDATTINSLVVTIPGTGAVTGQVFNGGSGFNGDRFLFVSEDGTISGWRGALGTQAEILENNPSAIFKGGALGTIGSNSYLYAADFNSGSIHVKGSSGAPSLEGSFTDPNLPSGYAPFNIQQLAGQLYVAYAKQLSGSADEDAQPGFGYVDSYDLNGNFLARIASGGSLNAPWGLALAPSSWGELGGKLLVGNFGDGTINVYDQTTSTFLGQLLGADGKALSIPGLWGITPGNGGNAGSPDRLYFAAGPDDETRGQFGVIQPVPLPPALSLLMSALTGLYLAVRRKSIK
ncbi:TIGR03118 family protein [Methylococcus sp. EFPC2]|uniref:TIGR03118 family protein n=1 Tax=Methylococcus sp. EFPC2 TaxID=2812648 RepID=UPI0019688D9B|nr:TIGR03118 family protein [Methylococcus sp. EFPC2]QSA97987.1 TIGR03118 family protein [Methylococcus sp. EFPC2]